MIRKRKKKKKKKVVMQGLPNKETEDDLQVALGFPYSCNFVNHVNSRGIWFGDNPLRFSLPLLMIQLSLITIITRSIHLLLKPFGQPSIVSQILGGVILGPSILGHSSVFASKMFPARGRTVLDTLSVFGFMLFIFLIGVKMDPTIVLKSGRKALAIGILGFFVPYAMAGLVAFILDHSLPLDPEVKNILPLIVILQSMTSFPVIACFLAELNLLNSEIGRLASSSSIICDAFHWSIMSMRFMSRVATEKSIKASLGSFLSSVLLVIVIVFGIRPAALWAIRHTPEGKPVKEIYIFFSLMTLMGCALIGEVIGVSSLVASFILGLVIPDGPPLGAALVERLDCFVSMLLMPLFFTNCGLNTDFFAIQNLVNAGAILLVVFVSVVAKVIGAILPPLFCRMPFRDAFSFALVMNSKGILELAILTNLKREKLMSEECFGIMIISVVVVTGVISPLVKALYDPSKRFIAYKRRTIQHSKRGEQLCILACIHSRENVKTMINLLNATNPTKDTPMNLFVLHLVKLMGRSSPILVAHLPREKPSLNPTQSEQIFNSFHKFEEPNNGAVTVHCFKGVSPYATMHNDVCSLALEKRTCLVIMPFHKQRFNGERIIESPFALRHLNKNVLDKAPCSVAVLVDRGNQKKGRLAIGEHLSYYVVVLFFGGPDDREAAALAGRMSEHPNVNLTLIRFSSANEIVAGGGGGCGTERSRMLDSEALREFRHNALKNEQVSYHEKVVKDLASVLSVTKPMETSCDLIMVGRSHRHSQFISDLTKCREHIELGAVGEALLTSHSKASKASVLAVQQQTRIWGLHDPEESLHLRKVNL